MEEHIDKKLDEMKLTFVGDLSDNVMYALMYGSAIMGVDFKAVGPKETVCDPKVLEVSQELAKKSGATITISHDPEDVKGSDVIYTDIWVSMGESEDLYPVRVNALSPYKVTMKMMKDTGNDKCLFMHCLPAYHDFETSVARDMRDRLGLDIREVEDEVFRSENSVVFDEAENRTHSIKAVMVATLGRQFTWKDGLISMKEKILEFLKQQDGFISGQRICDELGVSRTAVWKYMNLSLIHI